MSLMCPPVPTSSPSKQFIYKMMTSRQPTTGKGVYWDYNTPMNRTWMEALPKSNCLLVMKDESKLRMVAKTRIKSTPTSSPSQHCIYKMMTSRQPTTGKGAYWDYNTPTNRTLMEALPRSNCLLVMKDESKLGWWLRQESNPPPLHWAGKTERKSLKNGLKFVSSSLKTAAQLGWYVVPECKHELVVRQERMEHIEDPILIEL